MTEIWILIALTAVVVSQIVVVRSMNRLQKHYLRMTESNDKALDMMVGLERERAEFYSQMFNQASEAFCVATGREPPRRPTVQ